MKPDELRALADALRPMAKAPCFDGIDIEHAADYLRAQADAQPVAWRCEVRGDGSNPKLGAVDWRHYYTTTSEREAQAFVARCGNGIEGRAVPLYPHAAPAVPQAEPCIGNDPICPCQDGDACHYKDSADGTKAWPVPQSEPKREPLPGLAPTHRCPACGAFWRQCDDASWNLRSASCCGLCDAGRVELVRLLDEPKREPSLGELMREQRQSRIVAGAYPDGNPNAGAMMAQTRQAEPKRPAFLDEIGRVKEHIASWPQWMKDAMVSAAATLPVTEPKREPLSDERIDEIGDPFGYFQYGDAQGDKRRAFARAVERAAYERAADIVHHLSEYPPEHIAKVIRALGGSDGN